MPALLYQLIKTQDNPSRLCSIKVKPMLLLAERLPHDRPRQNCIIDPTLALSQYGVTLIKHLGKVMDLWVVRELWNILDNPTLYLKHPELITPRGFLLNTTPEQERMALTETLVSLKEWEKFRTETDLTQLHLFWLGDSPRESLLPVNKSLDLFWRWEAMANSIDPQLAQVSTTDYLLPLAFRDTIALAMSLESAIILTRLSPEEIDNNSSPEICQFLEAWGISCQSLPVQDTLVTQERNYLQQLLIYTNTAKILWSDVKLGVVHLLVPILAEGQIESKQLVRYNSTAKPFSWQTDRAFWYVI